MATDLTPYRAIQIANFVKIVLPVGDPWLFSDATKVWTFGSDSYLNLGQLMSTTQISSEVRAIQSDVTVDISGIPPGSVAEVLNSGVRGSRIEIRQAYIDPATDQLLPLDPNPITQFVGLITSYNMTESWDSDTRTSSHQITMSASSQLASLLERVNGFRTQDRDQQARAPGDLSMTRVSTLSRSNFQFGKGAPPR